MLALLLVLLIVANGAPVIARRLFRWRWSAPIDGGRLWTDQRRLLGAHKTWRGLVAGVAATGLVSGLVGMGVYFGLLFGFLALTGDALSSFIKRRLNLPPGARATGLDQIPEAVLPLLLAVWWFSLGWLSILLVMGLFVAANILLSPVLHRLGIRRQPH
ncbi:CDP-archaeol synthase [Marinobacter caseinilyticus]|uniref:CDP-archaeol synthase n=1 Tax=Marinobacter caseinilyticus TaxID=2692195 RepID=UPI0014099CBA|nr:CDP-archaeol synthase [Marinobacter caseinilyticus]